MKDEHIIKLLLDIFGVTREQLEVALRNTVKEEIINRILYK